MAIEAMGEAKLQRIVAAPVEPLLDRFDDDCCPGHTGLQRDLVETVADRLG
jgi:hypothetical protein